MDVIYTDVSQFEIYSILYYLQPHIESHFVSVDDFPDF